jgi:hypothetical protein
LEKWARQGHGRVRNSISIIAGGHRRWDPAVVELPFSPFTAGRRFLGFQRSEFLQKAGCPAPIGLDRTHRSELRTALKKPTGTTINRSVPVGGDDGYKFDV